MMAVIELNGNVTIYSGTTFVGKLHIPSIPPNIVSNNFTLPTNNCSNEDWTYLMKSPVTEQVKNYLYDAIGLNKLRNCDVVGVNIHDDEVLQTNKTIIQSPFVVHLPQVLFSLHLLYEELKLNGNMSENLLLLSKFLYKLSMDLNLSNYKLHYFADFPILGKEKSEFQLSDIDANKISIPTFISATVPDMLFTWTLLTFNVSK